MKQTSRRVGLLLAAAIPLLPAGAGAQPIGKQEVRKAEYGASANWDETDNREAVIQIPAGWAVVSARDERRSAFGRTSMNVSRIEANGRYAGAQEVRGSFKELDDAFVNAGQYGTYQGKIKHEKDRWESARNQIASSHSAIVIRVSAKGSGNPIDRKGGSIQGTYVATLRYLGTQADLQAAVMGLLKEAGHEKGYSVKIRNADLQNIRYSVKSGGGEFRSVALEKGKAHTFSSRSLAPDFTARFDAALDPGAQTKVVRLRPGLSYSFVRRGSAVELVRDR